MKRTPEQERARAVEWLRAAIERTKASSDRVERELVVRYREAMASIESGTRLVIQHVDGCRLAPHHLGVCDIRPESLRLAQFDRLIEEDLTDDEFRRAFDAEATAYYERAGRWTSPPSIGVIASHQSCLLDALAAWDHPVHRPTETCWACLAGPVALERAHIVPARLDGTFEPTNFLLLCGYCHREHPDEWSVPAQMVWLVFHELELSRLERMLRPFVELAARGVISPERAGQLPLSRHGSE